MAVLGRVTEGGATLVNSIMTPGRWKKQFRYIGKLAGKLASVLWGSLRFRSSLDRGPRWPRAS